jgi:hypothetical protein
VDRCNDDGDENGATDRSGRGVEWKRIGGRPFRAISSGMKKSSQSISRSYKLMQ